MSTSEINILTEEVNSGSVSWSINQTFAFSRYKNQSLDMDIWMVTPDGIEQEMPLNSSNSEGMPVWSPNGKYISYISDKDNSLGDVWVATSSNFNSIKLTDNLDCLKFATSWSPDSLQIVFDCTNIDNNGKPTTSGVFIVSADSSGLKRLVGW